MCSVCKAQRLMCQAMGKDCDGHDPAASKWTGVWPGVLECQEKDWYSVFRPNIPERHSIGQTWWPCTKDYPGAGEDLNRWAYYSQTGKDQYEGASVLGRADPE